MSEVLLYRQVRFHVSGAGADDLNGLDCLMFAIQDSQVGIDCLIRLRVRVAGAIPRVGCG